MFYLSCTFPFNDFTSGNELNRRFPFEWKSPRGFALAFALSYVWSVNVLYFLVCAFCMGIGFYLFSAALTKDAKNALTAFGVWLKSEPNPLPLSKQFFDLIQFHAILKR